MEGSLGCPGGTNGHRGHHLETCSLHFLEPLWAHACEVPLCSGCSGQPLRRMAQPEWQPGAGLSGEVVQAEQPLKGSEIFRCQALVARTVVRGVVVDGVCQFTMSWLAFVEATTIF